MGNKKEPEKEIDSANNEEVFFDPEEQKKYEDYNKNKKIQEEERQKMIEKNRQEGKKINKGDDAGTEQAPGNRKTDL